MRLLARILAAPFLLALRWERRHQADARAAQLDTGINARFWTHPDDQENP